MIPSHVQKLIAAHLNLVVPKGHTWVVVIPEIGDDPKGQTTFITPITDKKAVAAQLRTVANHFDPQN